MKGLTIKELLSEDTFKYNKKASPADNYQLFQQAISFEKGVEFLSSSNEHNGPIIYLAKVPGLSTDLKKTKVILEKFNFDLLNQLDFNIQNQSNTYLVFEIFQDLYNAVLQQQQEYHLGKEKYFGNVIMKEYAFKELKQLKLPIIRSNYRGTFLNVMDVPLNPVVFKNLGTDMKKFLSSLYMMKRKFNIQLLKSLDEYKRVLFNKNKKIGNYLYKGAIADVIEIALALNESGNLSSIGESKFDLNKFCYDLCEFLGVPYTKLSNHLPTITKRNTEGKLFLDDAKMSLKKSSLL